MEEKSLVKTEDTIQDYQTYRKENDDAALVDQFMSEFQGDAKITPPQQQTEVEKAAVVEQPQAPQEGLFKRFVDDVTRGTVGEGGRAIVSGATKGVNEMVQIADDFNNFLGDKFATGVLKVIGSKEQQAKGQEIIKAKGKSDLRVLPQPTFGANGSESPKSVTGNIIEDVTQFLTGFGVAGKALKGVKTVGGVEKAAKLSVQGGLGDALAFGEHEERLSNVIQDVPALQNPVTEFLQAKPDDTLAEGKLKQAIEGTGLGLIGEGLFKAIKLIKSAKTVKQGVEAQLEGMTKAPEAGLQPDKLSSLGRPESNELIYNKLDVAKQETQGLTAKQIDELPKNKPIDQGNLSGNEVLDAIDEEFAGKMNAVFDRPVPEGAFTKEMRLKIADEKDAILTEWKAAKAVAEKDIANPPKFKTADEIQINFARIDSPEDLKQAMQAYANETSLLPKVQGARRGVRSNEVTLKAAEDIDAFKTLLDRREGQALNAEQITAARNFYHSTTEKLMELAKKAASPEASDVDQYAFRKMVATHHAVQKEVLGARAEAGRALQAWSIPSTGTPSEKLKGMETILDSFGGVDASKDLAKKLASFGDGQLNLSQINYITQKSAYARTGDALIEAWTAGLLTNPVTHAKNLASNSLVTLMSVGERYAQAAFPNSQVTVNEANSFVMGLLQSQKEAFSNAGRAFRTGETGFGQGKVELPRVRASSKEALDLDGMLKPFAYAMDYYGRVVNTSFKALAAGDEYSKTILYKAQLNALVTREGVGQGLKGEELKNFIATTVNAPSDAIQQQAREFAQYATFTKELGKSGKAMQSVLSRHPALKLVVPFFKTPVNIFKYTYERTPMALGSKKIRDEIAAGGTRQAAALAKIGMGSSMMMLGVDMSINGNITGAGPSDPATRAALQRMGWQPNSIKIGNKFYSYAGLEPVSTLFSLTSTMSEILTNYEMYDIEAQDELEKISTAAVLAISESTVNKTFLQGISSLMEALSDPDRTAPSYVRRTLSSMIPSGVAAVERAVNPEKEYVTNLIDSFRSRMPGFSEGVPKKRNVYGEVIKYRYPDESILDQTASGVTSLFNPFYVSTVKDSPLDKYLVQNGFEIDMPVTTQSFEGTKINLKEYPETYSRFLELRGQEMELPQYGGVNMKQALTDLVGGNLTQSMIFMSDFKTEDEKQDMINKVVSDYGEAAKKQLIEEFPIIDQLILEDKLNQENQRGF
jgi:hypothetical protein